ncbi:SpoIIE family protein phosphatase [Streptomyces sp. NPDC054797]
MGTNLALPAHVHREQLEPGDRLVLYTDGITEARDRRAANSDSITSSNSSSANRPTPCSSRNSAPSRPSRPQAP